MNRILLLIDQPENRRLLAASLSGQELEVLTTDDALDASFDLCIVDSPTLGRVWRRLYARKHTEAPVALPVLLVTSRRDIGLINPDIWSVVEELLVTPVQKAELHTRVAILLRVRRQSQELERRHQELYHTLVEQSQVGVYLLTDHRFTYINPAGAGIFGYRAEELINHLGLVDLIHADDRPQLVEMLQQHHTGERETVQVTVRGIHKDGSTIACDIYGRRSRYQEHPALMGQLVDVTERVQIDRAKNQFLAALSHELRTPLTNILGWVHEAQEMPAIVPQALHIIQRNAESQSRMVEDLLEVSRLIHGQLILQMVSTDLWQVTVQAVEAMQAIAEERQITMTIEPPDRPLPIQADVKRMQHVITNLLDNAFTFTDSGGTITVRGYRKDDKAVLNVHNTGSGIPEEQLPTIFTLFSFPTDARITEGLHLALPVVRSLVELHGGHVSVESAGVGQGCTFTVTLPLQ
ncbi:MAG: Alkaline phosphatase synthesis sensor protein PhoR [bacterium ADurb.Bin429]|nr:MAG: Alkaline phosphatase synthesis sensor protein PhoR [bacterium ADurb.Bin429]